MAQEASVYQSVMIGALLWMPMQVIERRVVEAVLARGFSDFRPTHQVIFQVCRPEGSHLTELAERAGVTKQTMGESVEYLVRHGYFERVPDPTDGRAVLIRRTERGWEINRIARQVVEEVQREWARALGAEAFAQLLEHLRRLAMYLDEPAGPAGTAQINQPPKRKRRRTGSAAE